MNYLLRSVFCALFMAAGVPLAIGASVSSFSPVYGAPSDTSYIIIKGSGFYPGSIEVKFNQTLATDAQATTADGTTIQASVPSGATTGPISVRVNNGSGWSTWASSIQNFTVIGAGPYVFSFDPYYGGENTPVTLNGGHFTGVTNVSFGGKKVSVNPAQDNQIIVTTPVGITTGPITVSSASGTFTTSSNFFVPPVLTGFSPTLGRTGTNVVFTGTNFLGATAVLFAGASGPFTVPASFTVLSNRALRATVPTNAFTGAIRVVTPAGSDWLTNNFVVQPIIYSFSPNAGPVGTPVGVSGANFNVGTPTVEFNGAKATVSGVEFGQLTAAVPNGATTGPLTIRTTDGSFTTGNNYFYLPAALTSFSPSNAPPGNVVTLTGLNFLGASAVTFEGMPASTFTVSNNTTIGALVPPGVPTGKISVTTPAGTVTSSARFYGPPAITGFAPVHGLPGTNVTVYGTNFLDPIAVRFGGQTATVTETNNGFIKAVVPAGALAGPITVSVPGGTATSAAGFVLDYNDLAVSVTAAPDPVWVTSNLVYSIRIANSGPAEAPGVTITNYLGKGARLISASAAGGALVTNANPITGTLGTIGVGGEQVVTLVVAPSQSGTITNIAVAGTGYIDPNLVNNTNVTRTQVLPLPLLSIEWLTNLVKVSWPLVLSNYSLQYNDAVEATNYWSNYARLPDRTNNENSVLETNLNPARFYRLKQ